MGGLASALGEPTPPSTQQIAGQSTALAGQQLQDINTPAAIESQAGSNYNQTGPTGSLTYGQIGTGPGGVPIYGTTTALSGPQQGLLNTLQGTQQTAGSQAGNLLTGANYGAAQPSDVIGNLTSGLTQQNTNEYLQAEQPFFTTQTQQLDTQLRNQGLAPGQPAYDNAMRSLNVNQGLTTAGATAAFEPTAFSQATQEYELPAALSTQLAGFGAPANPLTELQGGSALNIQTPNASADLSALTTGAQNQYQDQQNQYNAMISGLMGAGNAALGIAGL